MLAEEHGASFSIEASSLATERQAERQAGVKEGCGCRGECSGTILLWFITPRLSIGSVSARWRVSGGGRREAMREGLCDTTLCKWESEHTELARHH